MPASQTAAYFHGHISYDDNYAGTADSLEEGERLARLIGDKPIMFMKNHGVLVTGDTIAQAYHRLYRLERVCRAQVLAMGTGEPLEILPTRSSAGAVAVAGRSSPRPARPALFRGHDAGARPRAAGLRGLS